MTIPATANQVPGIGDFDGDGIPDLITTAGVLFGKGGREFTDPTGVIPPGASAIGDLNGDGKDDIVFVDLYNMLVIYLSQGRSGFVHDQTLLVGSPGDGSIITSVALADFNHDGRMGIAVGTLGPDDLFLLTNDGNNQYQITSYAIGVNGVAVLQGDFNRDGKADLVFGDYGFLYKPPTYSVVLHK